MKKYLLACLWLWISSGYVFGLQAALTIQVKDEHTQEPLAGAIIQFLGTSISGVTNQDGILEIPDLAQGQYRISVKLLGYEQKEIRYNWSGGQETVQISLHEAHGELETVTVTSTRSSRTVADIPTRVEFISGEELDEKANMKPGDIRLLLSESTGIMVQTTSATSANASIRIQGLDGRYTQILRDGFPLYSGGAAGLSLLQIAPLDLKQVEVIKGSASTLYGGGAIAGLVNLITKRPTEAGETSILLNGTSAGGFDASTFYGKRNDAIGTTLFAAYNANSAYDPSDIGLSAIPRFQRFTFNPRLFVYPSSKLEVDFGLNVNHENRKGGDMRLLKSQTSSIFDGFFEQNISTRISSQLAVNQKTQTGKAWQFKNAVSYFDRNMSTKDFGFQGKQLSTFSEFNYQINRSKTDWVFGGNVLSERFEENTASLPRDFNLSTIGAFVQNTWTITEKWILETGLRTDGVSNYGMVVLPRLALLWKINSGISSRLGGGLGYKTPTIFTEETERLQYRFILPLDQTNTNLERSYGLNWDINYRKALIDDQLVVHINHLFFYTYLQNPLYLQSFDNGMYMLLNDQGWADTKGIETNIRWELGDFKWLLGYTYTQAMLNTGNGLRENPLTPRHRINSVLFYEVHEHWKIGWESYAFSQQRLSDGSVGRAYWIMGFMAERIWENLSIYINFENFLDARQTRFDSIFTGSIEAPQFREIYAPLDGFVVNGGLKIRLN
jgi:outer membrane receptor for ferrienterochelin and colicins